MSEQQTRHAMVASIGRALADETCLCVIDALMEQPQTPQQLSAALQTDGETVAHALQLLRQAGLLLRRQDSADDVESLSPFGVYGARTALCEVLATTHEDGQCAKCGGCQ